MNGKQVFGYFLAFFGLIIAVNAVMITYAIRTHSGTVSKHPYEEGLAYNKVIEAEETQEALGWSSTITYSNGMLYFDMFDANHVPIIPDKAIAHMTRPIQYGMDFTAELQGRETSIHFPINGLWEVRIDATYQNMHYQKSKRIIIP